MNKPSITIDLVDYLQNDLMVYGHYDTKFVSMPRGALIQALDPTEQYVHVEFLDKGCVLWDIKRWKESEERSSRQKVASDKRRQQYFLDDDNINIVSKALAKVTGIDPKNAILLRPLAVTIIKEQKFDSLPFLNLSDLKVKIE